MPTKKKTRGFDGKKINFVQVGLGTNSTFIQNIAGTRREFDKTIDSFSNVMHEWRWNRIKGIAVEPVASLARSYKSYLEHLPDGNIELLQAALGDKDKKGIPLRAITPEACEVLVKKAPRKKRDELRFHLHYVQNMTCTGGVHPCLQAKFEAIRDTFNIPIPVSRSTLLRRQKFDVWTWPKLVKHFNFSGCDVLLIDAEGNDAAILRSLLKHCRKYPRHWPQIIQFESMGLCDKLEGDGAELAVTHELIKEGYACICWSYWNTFLVRRSALRKSNVQYWLDFWECSKCKKVVGRKGMPYYSNHTDTFCSKCLNERYGRTKPFAWSERAWKKHYWTPDYWRETMEYWVDDEVKGAASEEPEDQTLQKQSSSSDADKSTTDQNAEESESADDDQPARKKARTMPVQAEHDEAIENPPEVSDAQSPKEQ